MMCIHVHVCIYVAHICIHVHARTKPCTYIQDIEGRKDFKEIFDECAAVLYKEIDYIQEGMNADRFRRNFKSEAWVKVPTIYWQVRAHLLFSLPLRLSF